MSVHFYEPSAGHGLPHDPFKAIIAPRPIGWISTISADGRPNLAPYSFFNALSSSPPIIGFSSEGWKHTVRNIKETGEFVFNLATAQLAEQMNITGAPFADGENELEAAGLNGSACRLVRPPRVEASPAALECRLLDITQLRDLEGAMLPRYFVTGQVVGVHIRAEFLKDGLFDTAAARPIARCGYAADYAEVTELLRIDRRT